MRTKMKTVTYDELALQVLLSKDSRPEQDKKLAALARHANEFLTRTMPCPECGSTEQHEDNGCSGFDLSLLCTECGTTWEPLGE